MWTYDKTVPLPEPETPNPNETFHHGIERFKWQERWQSCLHESCGLCGGTGINKVTGGACVHGISCPCPKCTPR